ncbi:MAG: hypothetical protein IM600_08395 [Bacteroidetes bacterium]|jgi:hypothetical protein|nr:hypothetical protein [Bacteroidota bacterium]
MRIRLIIIIFILTCFTVHSQIKTSKPVKTRPKETNFALGFGGTRSVLYLNRNVKENNDATGLHFTIVYGGSRLLRLSTEYSHYFPINIEPTWQNINARTIESNLHIIARFTRTKAFFYPVVGLSYNEFNGFFTGKNDFLNLSDKYAKNTQVKTVWYGLNIGTGYEYYIKKISLFLDYKMRVGFADGRQLNIMDVCFSAGARFNIKAPSIYRIFSGPRSRYMLN